MRISTGRSFMESIGSHRKRARFFTLSIAGIFIAAIFILGGQAPARLPAPQIPDDLGGVERYQIHVATDKPIYRTGERVYVRGVLLRADGHTPLTGPPGSTGIASFDIKGPKGDTVASGVSTIVDSVVGFS